MQVKIWYGLFTSLLVVHCGGSPKPPQTPEPDVPTLSDLDTEEPIEAELEFDAEAANIVLARGARKAAHCASVVTDAVTGEGDIDVVFDGPKGRSVDVKIGVAFQGASEQALQCIKNAFLGEIIPPFSGTKSVNYKLKLGGE